MPKKEIGCLMIMLYRFEMFFLMMAPALAGWIFFCCFTIFSLIAALPLTVAYAAWLWYDYDTPSRGSRPWAFMKQAPMWHHLRDYFDAELVKTAYIPANKNYIFGCHPHGVLCFGTQININSDVTGFDKAFPGITTHLVTLPLQFVFPIRRELLMAQGCITSNASSIEYILNLKEKGHAAALLPGGAEECLDSHADNFDLILNNRKGFVKIAIKCGAHLVPVYHFGETSTYNQLHNPKGSFIRKIQCFIKSHTTFPPAILNGIGMFNNIFGWYPIPTKLITVVGAPIDPGHDANPSQEMIDAAHAKYVNALVNLFEEHKLKYGISAEKHLNIN